MAAPPEWLSRALTDRREVLRRALAEHIPQARPARPSPTGGLNVWLALPVALDDVALARACREAGVLISPGRPYHAAEPPRPYARLSFAAAPPPPRSRRASGAWPRRSPAGGSGSPRGRPLTYYVRRYIVSRNERSARRRSRPVRRAVALDSHQPGRRPAPRLCADQGHRGLRRGDARAGHPLRGAGPPGAARADPGAGRRGSPAAVRADERRRRGARAAAGQHAGRHRCRAAPPQPRRPGGRPHDRPPADPRLVQASCASTPTGWRERYAEEFAGVLVASMADGRRRWRVALDVVAGAADARLHGEGAPSPTGSATPRRSPSAPSRCSAWPGSASRR